MLGCFRQKNDFIHLNFDSTGTVAINNSTSITSTTAARYTRNIDTFYHSNSIPVAYLNLIL